MMDTHLLGFIVFCSLLAGGNALEVENVKFKTKKKDDHQGYQILHELQPVEIGYDWSEGYPEYHSVDSPDGQGPVQIDIRSPIPHPRQKRMVDDRLERRRHRGEYRRHRDREQRKELMGLFDRHSRREGRRGGPFEVPGRRHEGVPNRGREERRRERQWWEVMDSDPSRGRDDRRRLSQIFQDMISRADISGIFDWDRLPSFTGHLELGPGFNVDWDVDVDGLFDGDIEWWKGPNVCVRTETEETNETSSGGSGILQHHFFSTVSCDATESSYKCTTEMGVRDRKKKTIKTYECCHGYQRQEGVIGCPKELVLKDILEASKELGGEEFVEALENSGFDRAISESNFTLFLPTNSSAADFLPPQLADEPIEQNVILISPEMISLASTIRQSLATHIVEGFHRSGGFSDEMLLETENPDSAIRINIYSTPKRLVTANCKELKRTDNVAINGVIHEVDGKIPSASMSIWEILRRDRRFTTLSTVLEKVNLDEVLKNEDGQLTLFAPTNQAFMEMDKLKREKLLQSTECLENVLKNHALPNVICSSVIQGQVRSPNMLKKTLTLFRNEDGELSVEGGRLSDVDIMANNGVIHVLEKVIVPPEAQGVKEAAKNSGHTKFFRLVEEAGLSKQFSNLNNVTFFIPTDEAFEGLSEGVFAGQTDDTEAVAKLLRYHVSPREVRYENFLRDEEMETIDSEKKISIKKHYSYPFSTRHHMTAQCSRVIERNIVGCEGVVHVVDKVLVPPAGDLLDVLYKDDKFSRLVATLKELEIAEDLQSDEQELTIFAPTNEAFEKLEKKESIWNYLQEHLDVFKNIIRNHIAIGSLCCSGVHESRWFIHQGEGTLDGSSVVLIKREGDVYVNRVPLSTCDTTATNGVVHSLEDFMAESIRKYVPVRHARQPGDGRNWWEAVSHWFEESQADDLFDVEAHWAAAP